MQKRVQVVTTQPRHKQYLSTLSLVFPATILTVVWLFGILCTLRCFQPSGLGLMTSSRCCPNYSIDAVAHWRSRSYGWLMWWMHNNQLRRRLGRRVLSAAAGWQHQLHRMAHTLTSTVPTTPFSALKTVLATYSTRMSRLMDKAYMLASKAAIRDQDAQHLRSLAQSQVCLHLCHAWSDLTTNAGATAGSGRCYYKFNYGYYYTNSSVYAAANLISNGTPNLVCPYYNMTTYTLPDNSVWQIYCGYDTTGGSAAVGYGTAGSMAQCMSQCNAAVAGDCQFLSFIYTGGEPTDASTNTNGQCQQDPDAHIV